MIKWGRGIAWRQGHFLSAECIAALGINGGVDPEKLAVVVVSHDCDLAQPSDSEEFVEVVMGTFLDTLPDGNFTNCKNLRRLHIECSGGKNVRVLDLDTSRRLLLHKDLIDAAGTALVQHQPCELHRMTPRERNILQQWLAARYKRAAFPDEFDRRLKYETGVAERLAKAFKDSGTHVIAVFFDVDQGEENARDGEDDTYELTITLLYATNDDPQASKSIAMKAAEKVAEIFKARCFLAKNSVQSWRWIELQDVEVIADTALSFAQSQLLTRWHADHISLRTDPPQPMM
ncbi:MULTISPECIES: hypothetical protein [unclassified Pseudomonas]|uniref:hypothetical protein n=1 Tax=unclassified Pseudomonas TaxID=196821 RepID=UPI0015A008E9|nr:MULTISPECIES: hypothetical protein [unclassified Pseudomonas]NWC93805.1 hypothetical protein [Pseudomonas sp. IPO3779]NWD16221.1 hypothetical protein [Pseudomonas sp. IPO3778]